MPAENTVVVIETTGHHMHMADITLIVHGDDEHSTHHTSTRFAWMRSGVRPMR